MVSWVYGGESGRLVTADTKRRIFFGTLDDVTDYTRYTTRLQCPMRFQWHAADCRLVLVHVDISRDALAAR